ncbi:hypothetical protein JTE90_007229 [Oedothorax gibbosus]|uniref:Uncharacterized protein n=1 Tax=Oedothorax gibbosus TaxID=931172 RepID=A0AAV6VL83_9ARAC|nr:hypothetical protein JTE90_007229 [Oedothorax gibbosus]
MCIRGVSLIYRMKIESILVTGANRGIGLEMIRQFIKLDDAPKFIFATYRNPDTLQDLKDVKNSTTKSKVILIKLDITSAEDIAVTKKIVEDTVGDRGLNLLINNAGVMKAEPFPCMTPENLELHFKANCVAPVMILQSLFPLLEKAVKVSSIPGCHVSKAAAINLTSRTGSIQRTGENNYTADLVVPGYKISKAALHMAMRVIAASVREKSVLVVNMCPGWIKTEMGGELEVDESMADMVKTFPKLSASHHGSFIDRFGKEYSF